MRKLYLDRNLQIVFGVGLMLILGVSSIMPVLPRLMRDLHVSVRSIGLVMTVFTLPGIFLAPIVGVLADRIGRKRILICSLLIFGLSGTACAFAPDFRTLLILRFFQGVGAAPLGIIFLTIVGDLYEGPERTAALGYAVTAWSLGTGGFPILGGALGTLGWQYPFLLAAVALPLAVSVHVSLRSPEPQTTQDLKEYLKGTLSLVQTRQALGIFFLSFLTSIILYGPVVTYVPVLLQERFHVSSASIGLILSLPALFTAAASSQLRRLSGRPGAEFRVLGAAVVLYLLSMFLIPLTFRLWLFLVPICLFGMAMGLNAPTRVSVLTGIASIANRAAIMSVNSMVLRLGQTVAPVLMGMVAAGMGIESVFWAGIAVSLSMMAALIWMIR